MRSFPLRSLLLLLCAIGGCDERLGGPPQTLQTHPRVSDRYARLLLRQPLDSNPLALQQEISCEGARLFLALGYFESVRRREGVEDSVYRTAESRAGRERFRNAIGGHSFEVDGPTCDSLNAIADREDPIAPVDSAIRNQWSPPPG